uniref:Uncharacterized protein n=1 Tax=Anguilla anguilla TaxID=7936 RepID=A0A0E9TM50_ANGAN
MTILNCQLNKGMKYREKLIFSWKKYILADNDCCCLILSNYLDSDTLSAVFICTLAHWM